VTPRTEALSQALERLLPFLVFAAIITAGWFWFVQPRLATYLRASTDTAALEERARTLQLAAGKVRSAPPVDLDRTQREFEARVSPDDRVAEVAAVLAQAVLASAPPGELRAFVMDAGDRVSASREAGRDTGTPGSAADGADPRLALFPYSVSYTPLRLSFESRFETAGDVLWRLRDLPTTVEVRSAVLTRGMPLMKTELLVRVLQRGDASEIPLPVVPSSAMPPDPSPTAPRLAPSAAGTGAVR
jgi:hypothetical protein